MKTTYSILLVLIFSSCTTVSKMVTLPKVGDIIAVSGTKDDLYIKANIWMVRTFKDAKSVIQFQDKGAGKIMGKYLMNSINWGGEIGQYSNSVYSKDVFSLITISVKDNATKIDIEPMGKWEFDSSGATVLSYSPEKAQADIKALIEDYKNYVTTKEDVW